MRLLTKYLCMISAVFVALYSAGVFYHLRATRDLGIRCLFSDEERPGETQSGPVVSWIEAANAGPDVLQRRDQLLRVGGVQVASMMHLQRQVARLNQSTDRAHCPTLGSPEELRRLPTSIAEADVDGDRWAKIEFSRPEDPEPGRVLVSWLRLAPIPTSSLLASLVWFLLEMVILLIGALVVRRRPTDPSAVAFFALCAVNVVGFMGGFHWPSLVGSRLLVYPFVLCALLLPPLTVHFYLLFPRPLAIVRRRPVLSVALVYLVPGVWMALLFYHLLWINWLLEHPPEGGQLTAHLDGLAALIYSYLGVSTLMLLAGFAVLRQKFIHSRTVAERNQVKWLLGAAMLATLPLGYLLLTALHDRAQFAFAPLPKVMVYVTSLIFTLAYAISITRYKLLQVGRIVNRGILYVAISFAATALFCLMVGLTTALVGTYYFRWENAVAASVTAMLVVIFLGWIRDRFQRALDRRFYREKYRLDKAVRQLSEAVDRLVEPAQLARQLVQSACDTVGAERGAVYLREHAEAGFILACQQNWPQAPQHLDSQDPRCSALAGAEASGTRRAGEASGELACPLELEGSLMGLVVLGPKEDRTAYSLEDRSFLVALARTTALALHSAQGYRTIDTLKEDLQAKVQKIAEQQRRIMILQGELLTNRTPNSRSSSASPSPAAPAGGLKHEIRGSSPAVKELLAGVAKVAQSSSSVLIRGESGTGKELLARAVHFNSVRAARPFVQVHCAALSPGLLESELFGHVKGAFTGADRDKVGRFERADGGTLFLDEIGDINLETQTKLLRVLQEKSFERVGGVQPIDVDVRLIAATHQNLEELIRQGRFREDLFYRLNVISLRCPALRERREDIFELALHFLRVYSDRAGKTIVRIEEEALETLARYPWPGNIRQLENAVERAVVLSDGDTIGLEDLPPEILAASGSPLRERMTAGRTAALPTSAERAGSLHRAKLDDTAGRTSVGLDRLPDELNEVERARLVAVLAQCQGNKSQTAKVLGIPRSTLFSKLRRLGLD
jgi:DNA-binding NtrC family response regulator